jgi:hypothetical protein
MSTDNNKAGLVIAAAVLGFSLITGICILGKSIKNSGQYEFKQEGPIFLRYNKVAGDMCYTVIGQTGKFMTDSWICMAGNKIKSGDKVDNIIPPKGEKQSAKSSEASDKE